MNPQQLLDNFRDMLTRHYLDFFGRASRMEFWRYIAVFAGIIIITILLDTLIDTQAFGDLALSILALPTLAIAVRRLHDTGKSGWLLLLIAVPNGFSASFILTDQVQVIASLLPFLMFVVFSAYAALIYFWTQPGTEGPNTFGPAPDSVSAANSAAADNTPLG